ncbi:MAG TPA: MDR family MFS transporter [Stellaceae bacterium]|nr:MDR family MFS transporter [Stellaceae bacterium]
MPDPLPLPTQPAAEPLAEARRAARRSWVFAATMTAMFMAAIEGTIVATAMPTIVGQLGGFELLSWVFTAYLLPQAITVPIYGRLADLYGRKRVLFAAIAIFLLGSALCGAARSMVQLVLFRVLQGAGAGGILPVTMTVVGDLYAPAERARIQGWLSSVWATAAILGPLVGAVLVAQTSWSIVFWINLPIGAVAVAMLALTLREDIQHRRRRIDALGALLMAAGTFLLMFGLVEAARLERRVLALFLGSGLLLLLLFVLNERRAAEPMLPPSLWRDRIIVGGNLANLGFGAVMMGITAFLPTYMQGVMGETALAAGLVLTLMSVSWSCGSTATGRLMLRSSYRTGAALGGAMLVIGCLVMVDLAPTRGIAWAAGGAALSGLGMGFVSNSFVVAIQSAVAWSERGIATSSIIFTRMIGQSVGTAVFGGILNAGLAELGGSAELVDRLMEPALRAAMPVPELNALLAAVAGALHRVYVIDAGLAVIVLAASLWLPPRLGPERRG